MTKYGPRCRFSNIQSGKLYARMSACLQFTFLIHCIILRFPFFLIWYNLCKNHFAEILITSKISKKKHD